jgi:hypothetical protein
MRASHQPGGIRDRSTARSLRDAARRIGSENQKDCWETACDRPVLSVKYGSPA